MELKSQGNLKFVIGVFVGVALTASLVLKFAPPLLNPNAMPLLVEFERHCNADTSLKAHIKDGVPTDCFREAVAATSGLAVMAIYVDQLWKISRTEYGADPAKDKQWQELAMLSVKRFDEVEWPVVAFANVPVLNKIYSPPGLLQCVESLRAGSTCKESS